VHSKETRQDKTRPAQDNFKAASLQEKAAYEVWFKCVRRNKYAMFDEVARERGAWDDLCVEPQVRALAGRVFRKPCKKFYDDNKGLEAHQKLSFRGGWEMGEERIGGGTQTRKSKSPGSSRAAAPNLLPRLGIMWEQTSGWKPDAAFIPMIKK